MKIFLIKFSLFALLLLGVLFLLYKLDLVKDKNVIFSFENEFKEKISILEYGSNELFANADFFKKAKEKLQTEETDFIEADLSEMKLRVYKKGVISFEVPIKTKGKEGSWWETPSGIYKIQSREENHFSSFGNVYQPYSLAFEGNFFIHGWPYHPDGTPVASSFSGGCIRLEDEYAKRVFENTRVGMPVLVFEKDFESDDFKHSMLTPNVSTSNYLVADLKNNFVLAENNSSEKFYVGKISKLLTALVAGEYINLDNSIMIPFEVTSATSTSLLKGGDYVTAYNLLFPLLMENENEAGKTFADKLGEKRYVTLMNEKAVSVGMSSTNFVDVNGEGEENISNSEDLFLLLKYLYNNRSFILKISAGNLEESIYGLSLFNDLFENNLFKDDKTFIGGQMDLVEMDISEIDEKQAGSVAVIFEMEFKNEKRPIAFIIYGSQDIEDDIAKLKEYIAKFYL